MSDALHAAAHAASAAGLCILPVAEDGTKRPDVATWREYTHHRPSPQTMDGWAFTRRAGFGIVSGDVSGRVECWDFDEGVTFDAFVTAAVASGLGDVVTRIRSGYEDQTPGGGSRWLVRYPAGATWKDCTLARRPGREGEPKVKTLIELPTFAIVAPSNGATHPSGKPYLRVSGDVTTIAAYTAEERDALFALARSFDAMPRPESGSPPRKASERRPGDDFNRRASWREILPDWAEVFTRGDIVYLRRPGKDRGVSATLNALGTDRLHVFTSSSVFDPDRSYSKFGAYAVLQHGGDHTRAAKALAAQGYGRPSEPSTTASNSSEPSAGVQLDDFYAYLPTHSYIFVDARDLWPASSIDAKVPSVAVLDREGHQVLTKDGTPKRVKASTWLDRHRCVMQMTWIPGEPMLLRDRLVSDGGWIDRPGCHVFNLYRPPTITPGDGRQASRWLEHVRGIYPEDAAHIIAWLAHRVQRPGEKINHALVLGGAQGIGKDTLLEPVKQAVGPWNFVEVSPAHLLGRFNGFAKATILRVSEARDLGEIDRFSFYDHMKVYTAAPPDVLRVDEKHLREYAVWNVCGVIITTNHKTDGIYLPADDRRHYVAWSGWTKEQIPEAYWRDLWQWYAAGGIRHVVAYLAGVDLSSFNPKAPPPKTDAFWAIVDAGRAPEDAELADVLEAIRAPDAITIDMLTRHAPDTLKDWLRERKSARQIPHRLEAVGYVAVRNPDRPADGFWRVDGRRQVVYARHTLALRDQILAARELGREQ